MKVITSMILEPTCAVVPAGEFLMGSENGHDEEVYRRRVLQHVCRQPDDDQRDDGDGNDRAARREGPIAPTPDLH